MDFDNSRYSKDSVIDEKFRDNLYAKILPIRLQNYWLNKLWSNRPNLIVLDKGGDFNKEATKRMFKILEHSSFTELISKYNSIKSSGLGYGVLTIDFKKDYEGNLIPYIQIADGIIRYNTYKETETYIEVINRFQRGIPDLNIPYIVITRYGINENTQTQKVDEEALNLELNGKELTSSQKKEIKNINEGYNNVIKHNFGFVPAQVFRNRVEGEYYEYGQNDLNGFWDWIKNIDLANNRLNNEIDKNTTHLATTMSTGVVLGNDFLDEDEDEDEWSSLDGTVKVSHRTYDTEEGVNAVIINGDITIEKLDPIIAGKIMRLDQMTGIQVGYDQEGKTNDTMAKSSTIGDPAYREAKRRKQVEKEFWSRVMTKISLMDPNREPWENIDEISFEPRINDYREKLDVLNNIDKLSKYLPLENIYMQMFDITQNVAREMVEQKEDEINKYKVSALPIFNGNVPGNLEIDNMDWATTPEPEEVEPIAIEKTKEPKPKEK